MTKLTDKVVLVTGGASGIGAEIARRFQQLGNAVIVCGRNPKKLAQAELVSGVWAIECNIVDPEQCRAMLATIEADCGRLDILVNCAGVMFTYDFASTRDAPDMVRAEIETNCIAPLQLTHAALPLLQRGTDPAVVFVSSGLAYAPFFATPAYSGSKALVHHSATALREQFRTLGIAVFELLPPITDTPMAQGANTGGFKKSPPAEVVEELIAAMRSGKVEIAPGASKQLRLFGRLAPGFLFNQMTRAFRKHAPRKHAQ